MSEENTNQNNTEVQVSEVEKEARMQGWVPKEEFRGAETDWIDADTFVKRGREINPILKENNKRLLRELEQQKKDMQDLRAAAEEFKKFQEEQYKRKASELEKKIAELREEKKRAISTGDGELAVSIDDKIDALKEEKRKAEEPPKEEKKANAQAEMDPVLQDWVDNNEWYKNNVNMAAIANDEAARINRMYPELKGKEFLDKLDESLEQVFSAEKLGRKKKEKPRSPVEPNRSGSSAPSTDKAYESLPPEAKAACDRFVKQKLMTREQYVKDYFG